MIAGATHPAGCADPVQHRATEAALPSHTKGFVLPQDYHICCTGSAAVAIPGSRRTKCMLGVLCHSAPQNSTHTYGFLPLTICCALGPSLACLSTAASFIRIVARARHTIRRVPGAHNLMQVMACADRPCCLIAALCDACDFHNSAGKLLCWHTQQHVCIIPPCTIGLQCADISSSYRTTAGQRLQQSHGHVHPCKREAKREWEGRCLPVCLNKSLKGNSNSRCCGISAWHHDAGHLHCMAGSFENPVRILTVGTNCTGPAQLYPESHKLAVYAHPPYRQPAPYAHLPYRQQQTIPSQHHPTVLMTHCAVQNLPCCST